TIVSNLELKELFGAICKSLRPAISHDIAVLSLTDIEANTETFYAKDSDGRPGKGFLEEGTTIPIDDSPFSRALLVDQHPIRIDRMDVDPRAPERATAEGIM